MQFALALLMMFLPATNAEIAPADADQGWICTQCTEWQTQGEWEHSIDPGDDKCDAWHDERAEPFDSEISDSMRIV